MPEDTILIGHGAGGTLSRNLTEQIFKKHFSNSALNLLNDSAIITTTEQTAYTTDSYVIDPIFFPGGDIGKLAISGTVNDLLVNGAVPQYMSCGFIIEEGFSIKSLEKIVVSMAQEAKKANVQIVTGDTKVVKKGQCDKLFINTSGIGKVPDNMAHLSKTPQLLSGDKVIVSGYLGDHAITILATRNDITFENDIKSDAAPLNDLIIPLLKEFGESVKFMRDITRGGLATVANEVCINTKYGIELIESEIPIRAEVKGVCEIFGYDPVYLANEGKVMLVVKEEAAETILKTMKATVSGKESKIVGTITETGPGIVRLKSVIGGSRVVDLLTGEMLPRIC